MHDFIRDIIFFIFYSIWGCTTTTNFVIIHTKVKTKTNSFYQKQQTKTIEIVNISNYLKWETQMKTMPKITKKEPMEQFSGRIQRRKGEIIKRLARENRCTCADVIRTAVDEYFTNHNLGE
jgi:hypothetical protein